MAEDVAKSRSVQVVRTCCAARNDRWRRRRSNDGGFALSKKQGVRDASPHYIAMNVRAFVTDLRWLAETVVKRDYRLELGARENA